MSSLEVCTIKRKRTTGKRRVGVRSLTKDAECSESAEREPRCMAILHVRYRRQGRCDIFYSKGMGKVGGRLSWELISLPSLRASITQTSVLWPFDIRIYRLFFIIALTWNSILRQIFYSSTSFFFIDNFHFLSLPLSLSLLSSILFYKLSSISSSKLSLPLIRNFCFMNVSQFYTHITCEENFFHRVKWFIFLICIIFLSFFDNSERVDNEKYLTDLN